MTYRRLFRVVPMVQRVKIAAIMIYSLMSASVPSSAATLDIPDNAEWSIAGIAREGSIILIRIDGTAIDRRPDDRVFVQAYASLLDDNGVTNVMMRQEIDCRKRISRSHGMQIVTEDMSIIEEVGAENWIPSQPSSLLERLITRACAPREKDNFYNIIVSRRPNPHLLAEFVRLAYIGLLVNGRADLIEIIPQDGSGAPDPDRP